MKNGELFLEETRLVIASICTQIAAEKMVLRHAHLGNDVGVLGAAQAVLQRASTP